MFGGKPYGAHRRELRLRPRPAGHRAAAEVRGGRGHGARAVHRRRRRRSSSGSKDFLNAAQPEGPEVALRGAAVHQVAVASARREDARYVGLTHAALPAAAALRRRRPSRSRRSTTRRTSSASTTRTCGATPPFAFATRLADSFAKYRWCPNIIGPQAGGTVENLPLHQYEAMGEIQTKIPTEVMLTERREFELSEEGFIGLDLPQGLGQRLLLLGQLACQKPKYFGQSEEGKAAETQLPARHAAARTCSS